MHIASKPRKGCWSRWMLRLSPCLSLTFNHPHDLLLPACVCVCVLLRVRGPDSMCNQYVLNKFASLCIHVRKGEELIRKCAVGVNLYFQCCVLECVTFVFIEILWLHVCLCAFFQHLFPFSTVSSVALKYPRKNHKTYSEKGLILKFFQRLFEGFVSK